MHWCWHWIHEIMSDPIDKARYSWLTKFDTDYRLGPEHWVFLKRTEKNCSHIVFIVSVVKNQETYFSIQDFPFFSSLGILWLPWPLPEKECVPLWLQHQGDFVASRLHGWHSSYHRRCWLQGRSTLFLSAVAGIHVDLHLSLRWGQVTSSVGMCKLLQRSRNAEKFK